MGHIYSVCVRERESGRERERESVCVCVCVCSMMYYLLVLLEEGVTFTLLGLKGYGGCFP